MYILVEKVLSTHLIMHHEAIRYSLDPKVTIAQLAERTEYDTNKYTKLKDRMMEHHVGSMMISDTDVHYKLLSIRPKVQIIYYIGDISLLNKKILGIVGPRAMSGYGKRVLDELFTAAHDFDLVTISGMAEGVDQYAHELSCTHAIPTIAVLGGGLGRYLQRPEAKIIQQIVAAGGLVISEYKLGERPTTYTFPQRNRLIAGLADVLFLPEAGEKSGSLITVDCAITMKKPVYATPNSIFTPTSAGILPRMETGYVKPVFDLPKFLSHYFIAQKTIANQIPMKEFTAQEQEVLSIISSEQGIGIHQLVQTTGKNIQDIIQLLTILEIKGTIHQHSPGTYVIV